MNAMDNYRRNLLQRLDSEHTLLSAIEASIAEKLKVRDEYREEARALLAKADALDERVLAPLGEQSALCRQKIVDLQQEVDSLVQITETPPILHRPKTRHYRVRPVTDFASDIVSLVNYTNMTEQAFINQRAFLLWGEDTNINIAFQNGLWALPPRKGSSFEGLLTKGRGPRYGDLIMVTTKGAYEPIVMAGLALTVMDPDAVLVDDPWRGEFHFPFAVKWFNSPSTPIMARDTLKSWLGDKPIRHMPPFDLNMPPCDCVKLSLDLWKKTFGLLKQVA